MIRFARDEGFVYLQLSCDDDRIRADLIPRCKFDDIIPYECIRAHRHFLPVSDCRDPLCCGERHFVDGVLRADFLKDSDQGVGDRDQEKQRVFECADNEETDGKNQKYEIEKGQRMGEDDLPDRFGGRFDRGIVQSGVLPFAYLLRC